MRTAPGSYLLVVFLAVLMGAGIADPTTAGAQTVTYQSFPAKVGSGLQSTVVLARLSSSQHGGVTMHIASADTFLAFVSSNVQTPGTEYVDIFIPNGSLQAQFYIQAVEDTLGFVSVTASAPGFGGVVDSTEVVVPAMQLFALNAGADVSAAPDAFQIQVGLPNSTGTTLQLSQAARAGGPGLTATVSHTNPAAAQLVTTGLTAQVVTVIVLPGQNSSGSTVAVGGVALDGIGAGGVTQVTAAIPGFFATAADTQTVTLTQSFITYSATPFELGSGLQAGQKRVTLSGPEHGGVTVHVESSDSLLTLVSASSTTAGKAAVDLVIANGVTQANFYISAPEDTTGTATITASTPGFISGVENVDVIQPAYRINALASSIDVFDPPDVFIVEVGTPKLDMTTLQATQAVRAGGVPLVVTLVSSDSLVGKFALQSDTVGIATTPINVGSFATPGALLFGGVSFDGIGLGTTRVQASIPGFVSTAAGSLDVTVTMPAISFTNMPANGVGSGLQSGVARAALGASAHGGTSVRIKTSDAALIRVSAHIDSVGRDSVDVNVPDGQTLANFYIHALEDTTGTATIMANAPGFSGASAPVNVVQPGIRIHSDLANSVDTIDPPDAFSVQVGAPVFSTVQPQQVRAGAQPVWITVALDDSLLATLQTLADTSDVAMVPVVAGQSFSPASVAAGGVALDGLAPGVVTVSASAPGYATVGASQVAVTITAPAINVTGLFSVIGGGLQSPELIANLSASNHGGVMLHVETSDTLVVLVSDGLTAAGAEFVDIFVPNGVDDPRFFIQGVDGATGSATVAVSAPGFVGTSVFPSVVQPAIDIANLSSTIDVGDPDDAFTARVGVPFSGNTVVQYTQARRGGAPPLVVTLVSNDTTAAKLKTTLVTGDSVMVNIAPGQSQSPATVVAGGVALRPVDEGQALIFASIPGFIQTGGAQKTVTVTNSTIVYLGLPARLGAGLETNVVTAQLGTGSHGGVNVHIEVDDVVSARVSLNALVLGSQSIDLFVVNGQTDAPFYLQAFEGIDDTVTVTASAPAFTTSAKEVKIVPPALQLVSLADSLATGSADDEFYVTIGALKGDSSGILEMQPVRAGGTPVNVKVTSFDVLVGTLETTSTSADSAVVTIGIGQGQTPPTVAGGGMAFHPLAVGHTLVEATAPGFYTSEAGSSTVYVVEAPTGIFDGGSPPRAVSLQQNYPNPFNPSTTIHFVLPERMHAELAIFDVRGRRVVTLVDRDVSAGDVSVMWDGRDQNGSPVSSGVFFCRLRAGSFVQTRKMVLLK